MSGTTIPWWQYRFPSAQRSQASSGPVSTTVGDHVGIPGVVLFCFQISFSFHVLSNFQLYTVCMYNTATNKPACHHNTKTELMSTMKPFHLPFALVSFYTFYSSHVNKSISSPDYVLRPDINTGLGSYVCMYVCMYFRPFVDCCVQNCNTCIE